MYPDQLKQAGRRQYTEDVSGVYLDLTAVAEVDRISDGGGFELLNDDRTLLALAVVPREHGPKVRTAGCENSPVSAEGDVSCPDRDVNEVPRSPHVRQSGQGVGRVSVRIV